MRDIYPLTIITERYQGAYSGAVFTAWNKSADEIPRDIDGSDTACAAFWKNANRAEIGFGDTPDKAYQDLCAKMGVQPRQSKIKYWVYELDISARMMDVINRILQEEEMTLEEYFHMVIQDALDDPEGTKMACEKMKEHQKDFRDISVVRFYPVYREETQAQARHRALEQEFQST